MHQYCTQMWAVQSALITQSVQTEIILTEESGLTVYTRWILHMIYCTVQNCSATAFIKCSWRIVLQPPWRPFSGHWLLFHSLPVKLYQVIFTENKLNHWIPNYESFKHKKGIWLKGWNCFWYTAVNLKVTQINKEYLLILAVASSLSRFFSWTHERWDMPILLQFDR